MQLRRYIASLSLFAVSLPAHAADLNVGSGTMNWQVTSIEDSTGPTHRKINLVGRPMPDVAPPAKEQTDEKPKEPAFVDAFTQRLQYSVDDIYIPLPGGELALSVKRTLRPEIWTLRFGVLPFQRPDRPFGLGWGTNLVVAIEFTHTLSPNGAVDYAYVTDEQGESHRFLILKNVAANREEYLALPSSKTEQDSFLNTLEKEGSGWVFKKPHGTELHFDAKTVFLNNIRNDRFKGPGIGTTYSWARVKYIKDRLDNRIDYNYSGDGLIPNQIKALKGGQRIAISSSEGRINSVQDPMNRTITYSYFTGTVPLSTATNGDGTGSDVWVNPNSPPLTTLQPTDPYYISKEYTTLQSATNPIGAKIDYTWSVALERDQSPPYRWGAITGLVAPTDYYHCDLKSISDPRVSTWTYDFEYEWDHTKKVLISNVPSYPLNGVPRRLKTITLPNDKNVTFVGEGEIQLAGDDDYGDPPSFQGTKKMTVTDAMGRATTYKFLDPSVEQLKEFQNNVNIGWQYWQRRAPYLVMFTRMVIDHPDDLTPPMKDLIEEFRFDPLAAMNLVYARDFWGNVTTYEYEDVWNVFKPHLWLTGLITGEDYPFVRYPQPTKQTNARAKSSYFNYSLEHRLPIYEKDEEGRVTDYVRDSRGRVTKETIKEPGQDAGVLIEKRRITYKYEADWPAFVTEKRIEVLEGGGYPAWIRPLVTKFVPDNRGRVKTEIVDPDGLALTTQYTYDSNNNRTQVTDSRGKVTKYFYDAGNRLKKITYPGATKEFAYDLAGNRTIEKNENSKGTVYSYDKFNRLTQKRVQMGLIQNDNLDLLTKYEYNAVHSLISIIDPMNLVTKRGYDRIQRLVSVQRGNRGAITYRYKENSGSLTFDGNVFRPTLTIDPEGYHTKTIYDELGRPTNIRKAYREGDRTGTNTAFVVVNQYDDVGNATSVTETSESPNPPLRTRTTLFKYDFMNRPIKTTHPGGSFKETKYTSTGLLWQLIDERFKITETEYDAAGRPSIVRRPTVDTIPTVTKTEYDAAGNVVKVTDPNGNIWSYEYSGRNWKKKAIGPAVRDEITGSIKTPITTYEYDGVGNVIKVTDPKGAVTKTEYDFANRPTKIVHPSVFYNNGNVVKKTLMRYDKNGNLEHVTNPAGAVTTNTYNVLNLLKTSTQHLGNKVKLMVSRTYDDVGNCTSITDANEHTTLFTYDGFGRLTSTTDARGQSVKQVYDGTTRTNRTDSRGRVTKYICDERDRLQRVEYVNNGAENLTYTHDDVGNLLTVTHDTNSALNVTYSYDAHNRVETERSGGVTHQYLYDGNGNRRKVTYGGTNLVVKFEYDALNRLEKVIEGIPVIRQTEYFYDLNGNMLRKRLPNNEVVLQSVDTWNRITQIKNGSGSNTYTFDQKYDLAGNVTNVTETYPADISWNRVKTMTYDRADRMTSESTTVAGTTQTLSYEYDGAGNRTKLTKYSGP